MPPSPSPRVSSSSCSSSSSSSTPTHSLRAQSCNDGDADPTPLMNRTDNDAKPASPDDQRLVYFWTWSGVSADVTRPEIADKLQAAYRAQGQVIQHMSVFRERHQQSQSLEQNWHFHAVVQTTHLCRWRLLARRLREKENATMHCASGGSGRNSYWSGFAYCYAPSSKKPLSELDLEYWLPPGQPDIVDWVFLPNGKMGVRSTLPLCLLGNLSLGSWNQSEVST